MGVRYPGLVSRHNLVPVVGIDISCPRLGPFGFCTTVVVGVFGRHGATHDLAQWGVSRSGRERVSWQ